MKKRAPQNGSLKSSTITAKSLKSVEMTFLFPLDNVPRPDDIEALHGAVVKVLTKYKARYVGLASPVLQQHLETYWALKDEAAALKQSGTAEEKADLEDRWRKSRFEGKVWS